jgi:hypothetical protein
MSLCTVAPPGISNGLCSVPGIYRNSPCPVLVQGQKLYALYQLAEAVSVLYRVLGTVSVLYDIVGTVPVLYQVSKNGPFAVSGSRNGPFA